MSDLPHKEKIAIQKITAVFKPLLKLFNKIQNSKLRLKPTEPRWVVVVLVIAVVLITYKNLPRSSQNIIVDFQCPSEYQTAEEYMESVFKWIKVESDKNPKLTSDELLALRNDKFNKHNCSPSPWIIDDTNNGDAKTSKLYREIDFTGKVVVWMTYGRILVKNSVSDYPFMYFIAEPNDVIVEGASRNSPTTSIIKKEDTIKIIGDMTNECYWNDEKYGGCVPWVEIKSLQQI